MDFIQILADQKAERDALPFDTYSPREQARRLEVDSPLAQVVVGLRRSGKTTLCHQALRSAGDAFAYINFDDDAEFDEVADQIDEYLNSEIDFDEDGEDN